MRGGLVFFRGAGAAARAYLESDHSHADEYYLEGGGEVASWSALDADGVAIDAAQLDGTDYQAWVDWTDPRTGVLRGTPRDEVRVKVDGELRITPSSPRFVEMTVNVDKSLSVAAALNPAVSAALDAAEADATRAMNTYMAQSSVTRIGPRGAQRLVPVERIESVSVVHRSSRAGDPHRHIHVQWNTRVYAEGQWRALHTAATLKQQGALRGVGEATINSHAGLQQALAHAGFDFDVSTGRVTNLHEQARTLSKRAQQIERNVVTFEAEWRRAHPGQEPSGELRREWDQRAWAHERPRKRQSDEHPEQKWIDELRDAGLQVDGFAAVPAPKRITLDELDADMLRGDVLAAVEQRRSAWSVADLEGHIGVAVGERGVLAGPAEITQFAKDVAADIARTLPVLELDVDGQIPTWVRHFTSDHVVTVEHQLRDALDARGLQSGLPFGNPTADIAGLTHEQAAGAAALATRAPLVVIEGAAGSGKTTMLGAARDLTAANGQTLVVVAPTLRAAQEASAALGTKASSAHKLAHEYGFRWTDDGRWSRLAVGDIDQDTGQPYRGPWHESVLTSSTRLVIDEAGMVDQDLGLALLTIADETGASVAFVGDRAQLPAVGRGGVLDMAVAASPRPLDLTELHRFREPGYAELTIAMRERRSPGATFDQLLERGNIVVHDADALVWDSITADVVRKAEAGATVAVAVTSNDTATEINALVQEAHARAGRTSKSGVEISGRDELQLRIGDRIMTRRNDRELGVANRDTWTVTRISRNGVVTVSGDGRNAQLPREYVEEHTHLAYASTEYGVQGATVDVGHGILTDASNAQAVYVAATRGRQENTLHVVAGDVDEARALFVDAMEREAGDRGIEAAREAARRDVTGLVLQPEVDDIDPTIRAERMAYEERLYGARVRDWKAATASWEKRHPGVWAAEVAVTIERLEHESIGATASVRDLERTLSTAAERRHVDAWTADFATVDQARVDASSATVFRRKTAGQAYDTAVARFTATHGHEPVATPPRALRERWQTAAIRPGVDARLDELRKHAGELRANLESLKSDPVPRPPARPSTGTAAQEAAKDARYLQRQRQRTAQERNRATAAPTAQPKTPRHPGLER